MTAEDDHTATFASPPCLMREVDLVCCRLGCSGGFYDRTLAALPKCTRVFGVSYTLAAIPMTYPQWNDIQMGVAVTQNGLAATASNARDVPT